MFSVTLYFVVSSSRSKDSGPLFYKLTVRNPFSTHLCYPLLIRNRTLGVKLFLVNTVQNGMWWWRVCCDSTCICTCGRMKYNPEAATLQHPCRSSQSSADKSEVNSWNVTNPFIPMRPLNKHLLPVDEVPSTNWASYHDHEFSATPKSKKRR